MRRILLVMALLLLCTLPAHAEEADSLQETVLFDGAGTVTGNWELAVAVNTSSANGSFDPSLISEDGYFTVEYTGSMKAVYLAFSEWNSGTWASVNVPAHSL